jgi:catechol 2,3-dioxygenase-like lactoylglutathione lyase family enzyme
MITGAHVLFYSENPEADRTFFRDVLGFHSVDAGGGWLIFGLPPAEAAFHPIEDGDKRQLLHGGHKLLGAVLYLMCDDVRSQIEILRAKNVSCSPLEEEPWGIQTSFRLPSGGEIGLYQPLHASPLERTTASKKL